LEYFTSNKNTGLIKLIIILGVTVFLLISCNPTKYVPKEETLLDENHIIINTDSIKKSEILPLIKQKPNKRIFGVRFHLSLYDLSNIKKEKWPHGWLRNIGEEPVIFDSYSMMKSKDQIKSYLTSKGYFDGQVTETVMTAKQKSRVFYNIDAKPAYTIRNLHYEIADTGLTRIIMFDSVNCLIERGKTYDADILQTERSRLERFIRDIGFYNFSGDNIYFQVDSTIGKRQVDIYYGIKMFLRTDPSGNQVYVPNAQYSIHKIFIYPDYVPKDVLAGGEAYQQSLDTTEYKGYYFITNQKKQSIRYDVILQALFLKPGSPYNVTNTERTQNHLMSFKTYRLVNIRYNEPERTLMQDDGNRGLDCNIQLTSMSPQSFSVELEGTNTGGNLGGALNFVYQNKNLLHGAELFNIKLKGAYETFSRSSSGLTSLKEYGAETSLRFPRFFFPFLKNEKFIKDLNPATSVQLAYNYQSLPVYERAVANASFGYQWKDGEFRTHMVNPLQLNYVKIPFIDSTYKANVISKSSYLINSYKDVFIPGGSYSYIYDNQKLNKARNNLFVRLNFSAAGNLIYTIKKLSGVKAIEERIDPNDSTKIFSHYNILGETFAQFTRTDIDVRFRRVINDVSSIVYRGFIGVGIPYGNSYAMPFEKQYFEGGANGIRGWQVRSLGPGSSIPPTTTYVNQTGDMKLEANIEYRFKLFWILEGAVFVDAGNIWSVKYDKERPGSQFKFDTFYKDIAVGSGIGMRFDLKFVLLRADLGLKLRNPRSDFKGKNWILSQPDGFSKDNMGLVIGIGYPF
jgi:outer membrane protein assembly factor BamA